MKLKKLLDIVINEEKDSTEKEYTRIFNKYFKDPVLIMQTNQTDEFLKSQGLKLIVKKSDSDNMILKYAISESEKMIYLIGLLSDSGKLIKADYHDFIYWINLLIEKLNQGYKLMASPNKLSRKIIDNLMRKDKDIKSKTMMDDVSFKGDKNLNTFKTVILYKEGK